MAEDPRVSTDVNRKIIVQPSAAIDTIQQTFDEPSAVTFITPKNVEEPSAVTDIIQETSEEPCAVTDVTQQTVEEPSVVADVTQQTVEEPSVVTDVTQQTAEEPSVVTDVTQQSVEEPSAIKDVTQQSVEEPSAVTDVTQQTAEEQCAVMDVTQQTAEEPIAISDVTQQTTGESSVISDVTLQTVGERIKDELSAVTDVTPETIEEPIAFRDISRQTIKEPSIVRDTTQRKFGYAKVSWEIENFFFATENEEWEISSPEFVVEGFCVTRWRLILRIKKNEESNNRDAYICLERLDGENDTRNIRVCWNLFYKIAREKLPLCDREDIVKNNCVLAVPIKNFGLFEKTLQVSHSTNFYIEGLILVRSTENGIVFKRTEDLGLKRLSEEISIAYSISQHQSDTIEYDSFSDLKINIEGYPLICHKPIISARNKTFDKVIDNNSGRSEINFSFFSGKTGRKIFQYLYSGNLDHILRMPSISIDKAISYLGMEELKCYYLKDSIRLLTRFNAEEIYFEWSVKDIIDPLRYASENFIFSPIFSREKSGLAFLLRLGLNKDCPETKFLSLKLDVIEGNKIPEFYFICGITNNLGKIVSRRAMQWSSARGREIFNFARKSVVRDPSIIGYGCLNIVCSVFIPEGTKYQSVVRTQKCLRPEVDHEKHYRLLSTQLITLLETGKYTDLYIICQKEVFKVHKCVLFVRSPIFRRAIRHMKNLEGKKSKGFSMHDFDPKILRIILRYIYSGVLNCEKEDLLAVYEGSKKLSMVTLQNQSYDLLLNYLDASNAIETLCRAVKNADFGLVDYVCRFMKNNLNEVKLQKNWEKFIQDLEPMYEKLKDHARKHLKVYEKV